MARYVYKTNAAGQVISEQVAGKPTPRGLPPEVTNSFHRNVLNAYYEQECAGAPWRGPYPKGYVRQIHERKL